MTTLDLGPLPAPEPVWLIHRVISPPLPEDSPWRSASAAELRLDLARAARILERIGDTHG